MLLVAITNAFLQIATAVYFVLIDMITMSQYFYYLFKNQGCQGMRERERGGGREKEGVRERVGRWGQVL